MKSLSDMIPIWHFDEDYLVFEDGSLGVGFSVKGIDISHMDEFILEDFNLAAKNLLLSMKEGYTLQVFHKLSPRADNIIKRHELLMKNPKSSAQLVKNHRMDFWKDNIKEGNIFVPETFIFIKSPPHVYKKQSLFNGKKFPRLSMEQFLSIKKNFSKEATKIENILFTMGIKPKRLVKEKWFSLLFEYFNFEKTKEIGIPSLKENNELFDDSLPDQIALSDLGIKRDTLKIGGLHFKCVSLHTLPDEYTFDGMIEECLKLPFHFWVSHKTHIPSQSAEIRKLKVGRRLANSFASGSQKVSDLESESKLLQTESLLWELTEKGDKIVLSSLLIIVWGKEKDIVEEKADAILSTLHAIYQAVGIKEDYAGLEAFLKNFPGA